MSIPVDVMQENKIELRSFDSDFKVTERRASEGDAASSETVIEGYAALYNSRSAPGALYWVEVIAAGAFSTSDFTACRALFNHDENIILGSIRGGTLSLTADDKGLKYSTTPPDTQIIRDQVITPMRRGDVYQSSFRFMINSEGGDKWEWDDESEMYIRTLTRIDAVMDVSPVVFAAYSAATSSVRKMESLRSDKISRSQSEDLIAKQLTEERQMREDLLRLTDFY